MVSVDNKDIKFGQMPAENPDNPNPNQSEQGSFVRDLTGLKDLVDGLLEQGKYGGLDTREAYVGAVDTLRSALSRVMISRNATLVRMERVSPSRVQDSPSATVQP